MAKNALSKRKQRSLLRERDRLLEEMSRLSPLIRGSYFERYSTCSRPGCRCHEGKRHGPRGYVAVTQEGAQRQHYVPLSQRDAVRRGVRHYHRLLEIVDRLTGIHLELVRGGLLDEQEP